MFYSISVFSVVNLFLFSMRKSEFFLSHPRPASKCGLRASENTGFTVLQPGIVFIILLSGAAWIRKIWM
jgi:hypothetical protein